MSRQEKMCLKHDDAIVVTFGWGTECPVCEIEKRLRLAEQLHAAAQNIITKYRRLEVNPDLEELQAFVDDPNPHWWKSLEIAADTFEDS